MASTPSSASFKRAQPPSSSGNYAPSCLVDGCIADLSKCRDYHRRHKVCEVHSKTAKVSIRGQEQRFCQQCSRFHSLVEFDDGKRSCRKRLDGHNRRRRKPQPNAVSVNSGRFLSNDPGTRYILFSSPEMLSSISLSNSLTDISSSLNFSSRNSLFGEASSVNYKGEKHFSFLEYASSSLPGVSVCQPLINAIPSSSNGDSNRKMLLNGLNRSTERNRALSLSSVIATR